MSRVPRAQEHLKTAFAAEASSAARFRAYAARAEEDGMPALAEHWRELAGDKDRLAVELLTAAGRTGDAARAVREALEDERYENDVLYPRMIGEVDEATAATLGRVVSEQREHATRLDELRREVQAARGDVAR